MFLEQQISILEWFLKDHVTLKSGIMMLKLQLFRKNSYFKFFEYFIILLFYYIFGQINLNLRVAKYGDTRNSCSAFYLSNAHTHTHTHTHTHSRGAVGGSVPCSRVSPQSWYWRWRERSLSTPPPTTPASPEIQTHNLGLQARCSIL